MPRRRLSQRQKERIQKIQERRRHRLGDPAGLAPSTEDNQIRSGLVVCRHGANLAVADSDKRIIHCLSRRNLGHVVCGDRVVWQQTGSRSGVVIGVLDRSNLLTRPGYAGREKPLAANISQLLIVLAPQPEPNSHLLDQYLVAAESIGVTARILVNKTDLLEPEHDEAWFRPYAVYQDAGYPLSRTSVLSGNGLEPLARLLEGHTSILVGQSGVGKSSLVMAMLPDLEIQTGKLSQATGLGRHTTSETSCYELPLGGRLIDSPGVREFGLTTLTQDIVERGFREFAPFLGNCRFSNCRHDREPGCALRKAVSQSKIDPRRFESFQRLLDGCWD